MPPTMQPSNRPTPSASSAESSRRRASALQAAALCLLCASAIGQNLPDHVVLPAPTGPHAVGREAFDWTDEARIDPFAPEAGTRRSLTGYIWYPAVPDSAPRAIYVPQEIRDALARQANPAAADLARRYSVDHSNVISHALERAPLPAGDERFPVLLMKPGKGGLILQYASLAEELASHGYVVAGSDSPYTTPVVVHEDGRIAIRNARGSPSDSAPGQVSDLAPGQPNDLSVPVVDAWAADNRFILDRLTVLDGDRGSRFSGRLDLTAVGAFGHSMGGAAAMQFCKHDVRCRASVNLDGALWGDVATQGLNTPALFVFSDRPLLDRGNAANADHPLITAIDRVRAKLPNQPNLIVVRDSRHYNFADAALLSEPTFAREMGTIGPIDPGHGIDLTRALLRGFFLRYLGNETAAFPPDGNAGIRIELLSPTPTPALAQGATAEHAAIRATALDYIEGWYTNDAARMERALHPQLVKRRLAVEGHRASIDEMTASRLVQATRLPPGATATSLGNRRRDVSILDVFGNAATVRIDADDWVDYLHLVKVEGTWKILNVLWELRPQP